MYSSVKYSGFMAGIIPLTKMSSRLPKPVTCLSPLLKPPPPALFHAGSRRADSWLGCRPSCRHASWTRDGLQPASQGSALGSLEQLLETPFPSGLGLKYSLYSSCTHSLPLLPDGIFVENGDHVSVAVSLECLAECWVQSRCPVNGALAAWSCSGPTSNVLIWFLREPLISLTWEVSRTGH